ncbi:MAG: N-formylglutamate amidohydrolase [Novosphingobium sp.]
MTRPDPLGCGPLLGRDDPAPVARVNPQGRSPFLLLGDHAGRAIPRVLGDLGVSGDDLRRHIAWDIGVRGLGELLAGTLDAVFLHQPYSRLVIDCNRGPTAPDAIPECSDGTEIPGNRGLSAAAREQRIAEIHRPYQQAVAAEIARRADRGLPTILVSLHSFTPVMRGAARPWEAGVLHSGACDRFAKALLATLRQRHDAPIGDNEPYQMDGIDHTVPFHAFASGLPYAEIEVRQDLIGSPEGQQRWSAILAATLEEARRQTSMP